MKRRIAVVTGTRAEYGLLCPILDLIEKDPALELRLIVTGAHLSRRHGMTVRQIEHKIAARVDLGLRGDDGLAVAGALGRGVERLAAAFARLEPDLLVVLGDRYEALAAATAALPLALPVAHLHGGESSEGVWDESARHAITKLSHLHFAAAPLYAARLRRMGEDPRRVFCFGSPAQDCVRRERLLSRAELERELGPLEAPLVVATYHPATLSPDRGRAECLALARALERFPGTLVVTAPNADAGGAAARATLQALARRRPRTVFVDSLGQRRYFSLLAQADLMAGNSSSGLLEAPYFRLPAVNVGDRQAGRLRGPNVIDVPRPTRRLIARALRKAASPAFRRRLPRPPGAGGSPSRRIVAALKKVRLGSELLKKRFHGV